MRMVSSLMSDICGDELVVVDARSILRRSATVEFSPAFQGWEQPKLTTASRRVNDG